MLSRRKFVRLSLAAAAGLVAQRLRAESRRVLGAQLYTVREDARRDLPSVLEAIQKIGYREVETYSDLYRIPATALRRMVNDHGLILPSGQFDYDGLDSKIDYAMALGVEFVICPMLPKGRRDTLDDYKQAADQFNVWGEKIHQAGMRFGFHTHNYEFRRFGNTTGFETMMKGCDSRLVCIEMDCYWVAQAGVDPTEMLQQYGNRIQLLHLKDRTPGFPTTRVLDASSEHFTEVGAGTIHWAEILAAAEKNGVKHFFVERDSGDLPALESLRISFRNLQKIR